MKWNKQDDKNSFLNILPFFGFPPNICCDALIKDEKDILERTAFSMKRMMWVSLNFPDSQEILEVLFPSSRFWSSHLWHSSPSQICGGTRGALPTNSFSCFLPPPSLEFIIPIKKLFGFSQALKSFPLDFLPKSTFPLEIVGQVLSWPRNPESVGYFTEFFSGWGEERPGVVVLCLFVFVY